MIDAPKNKHRAPLRPLDAPTLALSTLGLGFLRPAPGTWGSMPPAGIAWILLLAGATPVVLTITMSAVLVLASLVCIAFGAYGEVRFGRKDASEVVADETAGQSLSLMLWPAAFVHSCAWENNGWDAVLRATIACGSAFLLFRFFDIIKPPPARSLEKLPRGWGVLVDDLVAGLFAAIVMQIALRLLF